MGVRFESLESVGGFEPGMDKVADAAQPSPPVRFRTPGRTLRGRIAEGCHPDLGLFQAVSFRRASASESLEAVSGRSLDALAAFHAAGELCVVEMPAFSDAGGRPLLAFGPFARNPHGLVREWQAKALGRMGTGWGPEPDGRAAVGELPAAPEPRKGIQSDFWWDLDNAVMFSFERGFVPDSHDGLRQRLLRTWRDRGSEVSWAVLPFHPSPDLLPNVAGGEAMGRIEEDMLSALRGVAGEAAERSGADISSGLGGVDLLPDTAVDRGGEDIDADLLVCSHIPAHTDDHTGFAVTHLVYLGAWDGSQAATHVLRVAGVVADNDHIDSWRTIGRIPESIRRLAREFELSPGDVVSFPNACPHWMTIRFGGSSEHGPDVQPLIDAENDAPPLPAAQAVAAFVSVQADRRLTFEDVEVVLRSMRMRVEPAPGH